MGWNNILHRLELPLDWPAGQAHSSGRTVADLLSLYFNTLLGAMENVLIQKKVQMDQAQAAQSPAMGQSSQDGSMNPHPPQHASQMPSMGQNQPQISAIQNQQIMGDQQRRALQSSTTPNQMATQQPWTSSASAWNINSNHNPSAPNSFSSSTNIPRPLNPPAPRPHIAHSRSGSSPADANTLKRKSENDEADVKRARLSSGMPFFLSDIHSTELGARAISDTVKRGESQSS